MAKFKPKYVEDESLEDYEEGALIVDYVHKILRFDLEGESISFYRTVIDTNLASSGFTPVLNTYYRHTGSTVAGFVNGVIYYYNGSSYKAIVGGSGVEVDYEDITNTPIKNQNLNLLETPIENTYYKHTGEASNLFTPGLIYLYRNSTYTAITGGGSGGEGTVKSVNGIEPDSKGDVLVTRVSLADNLVSPDNQTDVGTFIFRTSGGEASINSGDATLSVVRGDATIPLHINEALDIRSADASRAVSVTVDAQTFKSQVGTESGTYVFTYNGVSWTLNADVVTLSAYGIVITGSSIQNDSITVIYDYESESDVVAFATYNQASHLSVSIDPVAWKLSALATAQAEGSTIIYRFIYENTKWKMLPLLTDAPLNAYGVSISGDPIDDDQIIITYTKESLGHITYATPTSFKSIGLNAFNPINIINDASIDSEGKIVAEPDCKVAFVKAVGDLGQGYTVYDQNGTIERVGITTLNPTIGVTTEINMHEDNGGTSYDMAGSYASDYPTKLVNVRGFANDCYICISLTDTSKLCVHPRWSGYENLTYEAYTESTVVLPTTDLDGNTLTYVTNGLLAVRDIKDELNLDKSKFINYVGKLEYTAINLEQVQALGVDYIYDNEIILYVLPTPVEQSFSPINTTYQVADFGTEEIVGSEIAVKISVIYGQNLRDKLRTDVLTLSEQHLTDAQKQQVWRNLGLINASEVSF